MQDMQIINEQTVRFSIYRLFSPLYWS